jgi:uncharacterized protein with NRDE domain
MCLLLFADGLNPRYPLVVAANRDEFHGRPTAAAEWWPQGILAGRDLQAGGTWLGVSRDGRFGALTNFRDPQDNDPSRTSRGELVVEALTDSRPPEHYLTELAGKGRNYNGFNLLFGSARGLYSYSNRESGGLALQPGLYGLSNHILETPWPKVVRGKRLLQAYLAAAERPEPEGLFELLADREAPDDRHLPQTGIGLEQERLLSPMFIVSPQYGTRSSSVAIFHADGKVEFAERRYDPAGAPIDTRSFEFTRGA